MNALEQLESLFGSGPPNLAWKLVIPFEADESREETRRFLYKRNWNSLSAKEIRNSLAFPICEIPSMLTPEAFVYFLPAFLRMCEEEPRMVDCLAEATLSCLIRGLESGEVRADGLSPEQADCLVGFFRRQFRYGLFSKDTKRLVQALGRE